MHHEDRTESTLDRRSLLGILTASPFVFGLTELATGQEQEKHKRRVGSKTRPAWFEAAKREARKRGVLP